MEVATAVRWAKRRKIDGGKRQEKVARKNT